MYLLERAQGPGTKAQGRTDDDEQRALLVVMYW
jgi:hypothetical protein